MRVLRASVLLNLKVRPCLVARYKLVGLLRRFFFPVILCCSLILALFKDTEMASAQTVYPPTTLRNGSLLRRQDAQWQAATPKRAHSQDSGSPYPERGYSGILRQHSDSLLSHSHNTVGDHGYVTESSIRDWIATVDTNIPPLPDPSELLSAPRELHIPQVPCDVDMDAESDLSGDQDYNYLYLRYLDFASHPQHVSELTAIMSAERSTQRTLDGSDCLDVDCQPLALDIPSECFDDWRPVLGDCFTNRTFLTSTPDIFSTSLFKRAPTAPYFAAVPTRQESPVHWVDTEDWREQDLDIIRSYATLPADMEMDTPSHPTESPPFLNNTDFSRLMAQSFAEWSSRGTSDASRGKGTEDRLQDERCDAEETVTDTQSIACHFEDFDFLDAWSPPALRSSSSASSQDPFHLEIFSPTSEQGDGAAIWGDEGARCAAVAARERDQQYSHSDRSSSESPEFFSSSPFMGWSASSMEAATKPETSHMGSEWLFSIPLHQPQPIRAIPPIDAELLLDEFPEMFR
jgi:hypothetical protein